MSSFRQVMVDGRVVMVPNDPPEPYKNPPLTDLNAAYRKAEAERRDEIGEVVDVAHNAMRQAVAGRAGAGRRYQKNLRPLVKV